MGKRRANKTTNNLDLHGVKHQDADVLVEEHILLNTPPFRIITGHSGTMQNIVKKVLVRHDFQYLDGNGHIIVL